MTRDEVLHQTRTERDAHRAQSDAEAMRRELSQFDCRRTGGPVSDVDGDHCPVDAPCMRCRLRRAEETCAALRLEVSDLLARAEGAEAERDYYRLARAQQTKAAEEALARVKHIEWEMKGAPMTQEQAVCHREDHYPPHTPRPGDECYKP
jgi:hypothetical protein